jgi:hypothetical protein
LDPREHRAMAMISIIPPAQSIEQAHEQKPKTRKEG